MNYPFREAIIDYLVNDNAEDFMERILTITENYPKEIVDALMNPLGTHDTVRIISRLSRHFRTRSAHCRRIICGFYRRFVRQRFRHEQNEDSRWSEALFSPCNFEHCRWREL